MIQLLEDLGNEFERVAAGTPRRSRRWPFAALFTVLLLGTGAYAVPVTRAGIDEVAGWLKGGRAPAPGEHVPDWIRAEGSPRLVARSGDARLYVSRRDGYINVAVGDGFGEGASVEEWSKRFADHSVVVLGPASVHGKPWNSEGRFPLMGLTARPVTRVEVRYADGEPAVQGGLDGGFVVWIDARRELDAVVAFDAAGRELERVDVSHIDLSEVCFDARGCPPGRMRRP